MRTNIMRSVAVALGICTCGVAQAQYGGYATNTYANGTNPAATSSAAAVHPSLQRPTPLPQSSGGAYRAVSNDLQSGPALTDPVVGSGNHRHAPVPLPPGESAAAGGLADGSATSQPPSLDGSCSSCNVGQIYNEAAAAPWVGSGAHFGHGPAAAFDAAGPIKNWFGGGSLLFFDFEDNSDRRLVYADADPAATLLGTSDVSPGGHTGFEAFLGNYIHGGKYALTAAYLYLDPSMEEQILRAPAAGDYQAAMSNWSRMYIDDDGDGIADDVGVGGDNTDDNLYGTFDEAAAYRVRRDVRVQGLEFNFVSFGIGGAIRGGAVDSCGSCGTAGCGGQCGALLPGCDSRVQLQISHGLRWLQFKDAFEFAATSQPDGYGADDHYFNVDTRNDLFGYQFGSRANYCVSNRVNLYAGGKFGIYANDADYRSRVGTGDTAAQVTGYYADLQDQSVSVRDSDTVLSTLGELDLGLGFRLTDCWSLTGGYRMIGVTNVATSVGSISDDPANLTDGHGVRANDSLLLHGGYVGAQYNW